MRGIGGRRKVAARQFVFALRAGLDPGQLVLDRVVDGLIIAELEMQKRVVLDGAPVAAIDRVAADEIDGAGNPAAGAAAPSPAGCGHAFSRRRCEKNRGSDRAGPICASRCPCRRRKRRPTRSSVRSEPVSQRTSMPGASASLRSRRMVLRLREDERGRGNRRRSHSRRYPSGIAGRCAAGSRARRARAIPCSVRKVTWAEERSLLVVISASASASAPRTASPADRAGRAGAGRLPG